MRHVELTVHCPDVEADATYERIGDFARYPELTDTVLSVQVQDADQDETRGTAGGPVVSAWAVRFRKGTLHWTERDVLYPARRRIEFEQLSGYFARMEGTWQVEADSVGGGSIVHFAATIDLGIPSLADILDPVAESTLRSNILTILTGLLGTARLVEPVGSHV